MCHWASSESVGSLSLRTLEILWGLSESVGLQWLCGLSVRCERLVTLRAFSESVELSMSLLALSESVSPQLAHATSVSLWAFNVSVEPSVRLRALSNCRPSMSLKIFSESLGFR